SMTGTPGRPAPKRRKRRRKKTQAAAAPDAPAGGPGPTRLRPRVASVLRWGAIGATLAAIAASSWFFLFYPSEHGPGQGNAVEIIIAGHPGPDELAAKLAAAGVLAHPGLFAWWARLSGGTGAVADGPHILTDDASPRELMARLERRGAAHYVH